MDKAHVSPIAVGGSVGAVDCEGDRRDNFVRICSWNVEGLTDLKIHEICSYMQTHGVDAICLQETRRPNSDHYVAEGGFLIVLSGTAGNAREYAGVGFIVAPWARTRV